MPVTFLNPPQVPVPAPGTNYTQTALVTGPGRRLVISGQIGVTPAGEIVEEPVAQIAQALENLRNALAGHGMGVADLVKITVFLTDRAHLSEWRKARNAVFGTHAPTSTLLFVAGLADPRFVVEVEAEAFSEK